MRVHEAIMALAYYKANQKEAPKDVEAERKRLESWASKTADSMIDEIIKIVGLTGQGYFELELPEFSSCLEEEDFVTYERQQSLIPLVLRNLQFEGFLTCEESEVYELDFDAEHFIIKVSIPG